MTPQPPISRDGAQRAARHELSKAIYHRQQDPLVVRAVKAVGRWLTGTFSGAPGPSSGLGIVLLLVLALVVVAVIARRVGRLRPSVRASAVVLPVGRTLTAADHRALAEAASARGDHETAVLERMRAVARTLEERGVIEERPGRTAAEIAHDAAQGMPSVSPVLDAAARTFDDVVYGGAQAGPDEVATLQAADLAVGRR